MIPPHHLRSLLVILLLAGACITPAQPPLAAQLPPKVIHTFVALCDNASQGIERVPAKIGNGDDPDNNLYWGCDDGLRAVFNKSKAWQKIPTAAIDPDGDGPILQRVLFRHRATGAILVGDAYRGREIKTCLKDYFAALAGHHPITIKSGESDIQAGGAAQLIAYIGHNGLMEFGVDVPVPTPAVKAAPRSTIALCCISQRYFRPHLETAGARPLIVTRQLMYPAPKSCLRALPVGWLDPMPPDAPPGPPRPTR